MIDKELLKLIHQCHNPTKRKEYKNLKDSCKYYKLNLQLKVLYSMWLVSKFF